MLKVFLVGLMLTLTTGFGLVAWVSLRPAPVVIAAAPEAVPAPPPVAKVMVLAMAHPMRSGELVKAEDISAVELASALLPEGAQVDGAATRAGLVGAMVRRSLPAMQPILPSDVLRPTEGGFLAAVLAPNHRAVSIAVDAVSGTSGLIWPGDRVDMILTQSVDEASVPMGQRTFGETVLRNLRVIAVDQQLARGRTPDAGAQAQDNRTVTLEVRPEAAERVAVAVRLGRVALSVRSSENSEPEDAAIAGQGAAPASTTPFVRTIAQFTPQPSGAAPALPKAGVTTWGQDVSPALNRRPGGQSAVSTVRVFQGAGAEKEFKFE